MNVYLSEAEIGSADPSATSSCLNRKPMGFWSTTGWLLLTIIGSIVASLVVLLIGIVIGLMVHFGHVTGIPINQLRAFGYNNGLVILFGAEILIYLFLALFIALAIRVARWRFADYLALSWPKPRYLVIAAIVILGLIGVSAGLDVVFKFGAEDHAEILEEYRLAQAVEALPVLWMIVVILAPIVEEMVFRGFLLRGWSASGLRIAGTVPFTSLIFGLLHMQYTVFGVGYCILLGIVLAWLRIGSGSLVTPIFAHMLNNAIALSAIAVEVGGLA